jgi:hypothetical protein
MFRLKYQCQRDDGTQPLVAERIPATAMMTRMSDFLVAVMM